jgi:hypothetical protein
MAELFNADLATPVSKRFEVIRRPAGSPEAKSATLFVTLQRQQSYKSLAPCVNIGIFTFKA